MIKSRSLSNLAQGLLAVAILFSSLPSAETPARIETRTAIFAAGCFWCVEAEFEKLEGILEATSGFTGGSLTNPTYKGDHTGHYEAVEVVYDPTKIDYRELLKTYWRNVDPFDADGQFCDRGPSYRGAIFVLNERQRQLANESKSAVSRQFPNNKVLTPILDATKFWPVENYHQNYSKKNPIRYRFYRSRCGRDKRLNEIWK